jgi:membrane-associated protein
MELLGELFRLATHPRELIEAFGPLAYLGLFGVIFAETGLFVGFFLPGDSLLFTAGILTASTNAQNLQLPQLIAVCVIASIAGNLVGYFFGLRVGAPLFDRPDSRFFKRQHLVAAHDFYERHGGKTIVLARFLPFVRTFAPIVAGVGRMDARSFVFYSVIGGVLWGAGLPLLGYAVGEAISALVGEDKIDLLILPLVGVIIAFSILPTLIHLLRVRRAASARPSPSVGRPVPAMEEAERPDGPS